MRTERALNNILIQFGSRFLGLILYFFLTPYIVKLLGSELYGLNQLLLQTIGYFTIAELGIGISLSVLIYKYLVQHDIQKINALLSAAQFVYSIIGLAILILGIIFSFYIEKLFSLPAELANVAQIAFIIYIGSSAVSFFFSVPSILLNTSQKSYKAFVFTLITPLITYTGFICFIYFNFSVIGMALTTCVATCVNLYGINQIAKKEFPWLNIWNKQKDWSILSITKYVFIDKLLVLAVFQADYILISYFLGVNYVAGYALYTVFFVYIRDLVFIGMNNITNGAGEMYEKKEFDGIYQLWRDALSFSFFIGIVLCTGIYFMFDFFFALWMHNSLLQSNAILICFIFNLFYLLTVQCSTLLVGSRNLYKNRITGSLVELFTNIVLSVILIQHIGVLGAIVGTLVGHYIFNSWYLPALFLKSINKKRTLFIQIYMRYILAGILVFSATYLFYKYVMHTLIKNYDSYITFISGTILLGFFISVITYSMFSLLDSNFTNFKKRCMSMFLLLKNKFN